MDTEQLPENDDMRSDFMEAMTSLGVEGMEEGGQNDETTDVVPGVDDQSAAIPEGEQTTGAEEGETDQIAAEAGEGQGEDNTDTLADSESAPTSRTGKSPKAPVGWSPKAREVWASVPALVQEEILAREQEMTDSMANTKVARQTHEQMERLNTQYGAILAAEGVNAMQATESLMQTAAQLRLGNPMQKAQVLAEIIQTYGVDIGALDDVLSGQPGPATQVSETEALINQKMEPVNNLLNMLQQNNEQAAMQRKEQAQTSVAEFAQNAEFFNDVRNTMADFIDLAEKQGRQMTLQEAYDKACALDPQISSILVERAKKQQLFGSQQEIAAKKEASSVLNGKRSGSTSQKTGDMSLRESLNSAIDQIADRNRA